MKTIVGATLAAVAASFLVVGTAGAAKKLQPIPELTAEQVDKAENIYFDRCSGCHGALRKGATGPNITPAKTLKKTLAKLEKILYEGTDGGMPAWGTAGFITRDDAKLLAKFVQIEPPQPPQWDKPEDD